MPRIMAIRKTVPKQLLVAIDTGLDQHGSQSRPERGKVPSYGSFELVRIPVGLCPPLGPGRPLRGPHSRDPRALEEAVHWSRRFRARDRLSFLERREVR